MKGVYPRVRLATKSTSPLVRVEGAAFDAGGGVPRLSPWRLSARWRAKKNGGRGVPGRVRAAARLRSKGRASVSGVNVAQRGCPSLALTRALGWHTIQSDGALRPRPETVTRAMLLGVGLVAHDGAAARARNQAGRAAD